MTSVQSPPPGYEAAAAALISAGVPEPIANDPNDTSGLAGRTETRLAALDPKTCILCAPAGDLPAGQSVWGYDDQVTEVISR